MLAIHCLCPIQGPRPFFAYVAPKACHEPFSPAAWYADHWDSRCTMTSTSSCPSLLRPRPPTPALSHSMSPAVVGSVTTVEPSRSWRRNTRATTQSNTTQRYQSITHQSHTTGRRLRIAVSRGLHHAAPVVRADRCTLSARVVPSSVQEPRGGRRSFLLPPH